MIYLPSSSNIISYKEGFSQQPITILLCNVTLFEVLFYFEFSNPTWVVKTGVVLMTRTEISCFVNVFFLENLNNCVKLL